MKTSTISTSKCRKRLEKIGIAKYEKRVREIAFNWFAKPQAELKFDDIEEYILLSGRCRHDDKFPQDNYRE